MTGAHTSLPRLAVRLTLSHDLRGQSYNIECPNGIDVHDTLKIFQWMRALLGQCALGNAHPCTVDDSTEPAKPLLSDLDNMPHI